MLALSGTVARSDVEFVVLSELDCDAEIYPDYSGRAMYGGRCFGITCAVPEQVYFALGYAAGQADESGECEDAEQWRELARCARVDSMGLDQIVYFPGYGLSDEVTA